jgi:hypothetical protein
MISNLTHSPLTPKSSNKKRRNISCSIMALPCMYMLCYNAGMLVNFMLLGFKQLCQNTINHDFIIKKTHLTKPG